MKQLGYDVYGVEISDKAMELCKTNFGLEAKTPKQFRAKELDKDFDLITLWHVFEHVYEMEEYFELFHSSLKNEGFLIMAMPNIGSAGWVFMNASRHWYRRCRSCCRRQGRTIGHHA